MKVYTRKRHLFQPAQEQLSYEADPSPTNPKITQGEVESNLESGDDKVAESALDVDLPIALRKGV